MDSEVSIDFKGSDLGNNSRPGSCESSIRVLESIYLVIEVVRLAYLTELDTMLVDPRSPSRLSGNCILQERGSSRVRSETGRRIHDARNLGSRKEKGGDFLISPMEENTVGLTFLGTQSG